MIVKMIQNLGNKMEAQIYRMEAWIEKIQETFNKNLEEMKNRKINNKHHTNWNLKNTLEGSVAEQISKLEDWKLKITEV